MRVESPSNFSSHPNCCMCWCRLLTAHPASRYTSARFVHNKPSARPVSQFQTELFNKLAAASVYFNLTHYPKEATSVFLGWIGSMFGSEVFGRSTGMCLQGDLLRVIHNTLRPRADQLSHRWWLDVHFFQKKDFHLKRRWQTPSLFHLALRYR